MICILHVCLFPNRWFMLQFCTGRRLQIFLGFSHERCETLCVCVCVLIVFGCCFRVFFEGRRGTEWCDELKRLADTQRGFSLCTASAGEVRGHPHTDVKHRGADRQRAHTNKQAIIIHILFHFSGLWLHSSLLFSVKVLLNHEISAKSYTSVCVSFTVCSCSSCCVVESLISEGNINAVKSLVLPCRPAS